VPRVNANGVALGVECFGDRAGKLVLLVGGTTMHSWPDVLCERLAADAAALVNGLGGGPAHLAGIGVGGMVAQVRPARSLKPAPSFLRGARA
jgi:hypothetical protein